MADRAADEVRVLVVDDDPLVRGALVLMLDGAEGISVVGEAADGDEVMAAVDLRAPDVVLMDLRMARVDGVVATGRLRRRPSPPEVLVLTTFDTDDDVLRALRAGASGFLLKDTAPARIVEAVRAVAAGEPMLSADVTRRLMARAVSRAGVEAQARRVLGQLSAREHEVAVAVGLGMTNAEIADDLTMSTATVKAHVSRVLEKLALGNRTQVALLVHDAGLV
ncbi:response regulator transcription factor [Angustibacter peucedani]